MKTCCVSGSKNTANENSSVKRTKQKRLMVLSSCPICSKKIQGSLKIKKLVDLNYIE